MTSKYFPTITTNKSIDHSISSLVTLNNLDKTSKPEHASKRKRKTKTEVFAILLAKSTSHHYFQQTSISFPT